MRDFDDYKVHGWFPAPPARALVCYDALIMDSHTKDRLFQKGLEAFNSAHFYDAHEIWEEIWLETANPEKMFLQGLIQVAAAFHHYSKDNCLGCRNLLEAGLTKLDHFPPEHHGLEIEPLRVSVRLWLAILETGKTPEYTKIPIIKHHTDARRA